MTRHLRITVDLELDATPICGLVLTDTHPACPFRGRLELTSAIEQLRSAAPPPTKHASKVNQSTPTREQNTMDVKRRGLSM
jgi:hypothetical protein